MIDPCGDAKVDKDALLMRALASNAELRERNAVLAAQVKELTRKVTELLEERTKNSQNSNKPPSSDGLGERRKIRKKKKPTGRKQGAQKGHKGHCRELLPLECVDRIVNIFPGPCGRCGETPPPSITTKPARRQVVELLENGGREVTEYRLHESACACGETVLPSYDGVPTSAFGPRLKSVVSMMTADYGVSRRQVVVFLRDVFGIKMSLGSVSNAEGQMSTALKEPSDQCLEHAEAAEVKHIDETSWLQNFDPCSAWVIATAAVSVFRIVENGRRASLLKILQRKHRGILISDRASVFLFWSMDKRKIWVQLVSDPFFAELHLTQLGRA